METRIKNFYQNPNLDNYENFTTEEKKFLENYKNNLQKKYLKILEDWKLGYTYINQIISFINTDYSDEDILKILSNDKLDKIKSHKKIIKILFSYLITKYKNSCEIINDKNRVIYLKIDKKEKKIKSNREITEFFKLLRGCIKKDKKYILIKLLQKGENVDHMNMLIYDVDRQILERFEPYGSTHTDLEFSKIIDDQLIKQFGSRGYILSNQQYCVNTTDECHIFQRRIENNERLSKDPAGYCIYWSIWYADKRLKYSGDIKDCKTLKTFLTNEMKKLQKRGNTFRNFIRKYSLIMVKFDKYIEHVKEYKGKDYPDEKIFENYVKEIGQGINEISLIRKFCLEPTLENFNKLSQFTKDILIGVSKLINEGKLDIKLNDKVKGKEMSRKILEF